MHGSIVPSWVTGLAILSAPSLAYTGIVSQNTPEWAEFNACMDACLDMTFFGLECDMECEHLVPGAERLPGQDKEVAHHHAPTAWDDDEEDDYVRSVHDSMKQ